MQLHLRRMQGADAGYLYLETPTMHMHTLKVAILDTGGAFDFGVFTEQLLKRLHRLPPMMRRMVPVPWALNHPMWVTDRHIDPAKHLFHDRVAAPGGMRELEDLIGRIASTPLDRTEPLWELHACTGLADGKVAIVGKMHHALADGIAANQLLANVMDVPGAAPVSTSGADMGPFMTTVPGRFTQAVQGLIDGTRQVAVLPRLIWHTIRASIALGRVKPSLGAEVPRPILDTPRTSFDGALTARRSFATASLPLADLKELKTRHGVTLNDAVLGVVSGAMRTWLAGQGEVPDRSLIAGIPMSVDAPGGAPRLGGNRVSNMFTTLATDVDDPHARLHKISRVTDAAKVLQKTMGPDVMLEWVEFSPPGLMSLFTRLYSKSRAADRHRSPFNVIVSNVPGPRETARIAGATLSDLFSVGPLIEGIGLNITVWSYVDRLNFSFLTCPDLLPDLAPLVACLRPALDELLDMTHTTDGCKQVVSKVG